MTTTVNIRNLSKRFKLYSSPRDRLKEWIHPLRKVYHKEFWALDDVSFSISSGETLGIIGRNGSGKSTLLQIITMVMSPTSGKVDVNGKIAALLELGTGFDNELTGRENLFLNGSIMGLGSSEIRERIPLIEAFADIGDYFDQPVKLYSSGMFVRLAFSAAIHVDPDILIIDEALAVGDVKFQNKCYRKFHEFRGQGKTIIFVTHSTDLIAKLCDRAVLLHNGCLMEDGEPNEVINRYLELLLGDANSNSEENQVESITEKPAKPVKITSAEGISHKDVKTFVESASTRDRCAENPTYNVNEHRYGNNKGTILDYLILNDDQVNSLQVEAHSVLQIYVRYYFNASVNHPIYGITLKTLDGIEIFGSNTWYEKTPVKSHQSGEISVMEFTLPASLISGEYFVSIGLAELIDGSKVEALDRRYDLIHLKIYNPTQRSGLVDLEAKIVEIG